jgi:hypothetical protein
MSNTTRTAKQAWSGAKLSLVDEPNGLSREAGYRERGTPFSLQALTAAAAKACTGA